MPINLGQLREGILELAAQTQRNNAAREEQAENLRRIFAPGFDVASWMHTCEATAKLEGWSGAVFSCNEAANQQFAFGEEPTRYALISADGSQILPDRHKEFQYYYVQAGAACIVYGLGDLERDSNEALQSAIQTSQQKKHALVYDSARLLGKDNRLISPGEVSNKRDVLEIELLADCCEQFAAAGLRPVALADGNIVPFALLNENYLRNSRKDAREMSDRMGDALDKMRKAKALVAGYIDKPDSNAFVKSAWLSRQAGSPITKSNLPNVELVMTGLYDRNFLAGWLQPAHRTALFDPNWTINSADWLGRKNHAMRACYANFGDSSPKLASRDNIVRIEVPAWCATDDAMQVICAVLQRQTWVGNGWPFILKAAHEESIVTRQDQADLERIIRDELDRQGVRTEMSAKQFSKNQR
jgi:hypothetical protein